MIGIKNVIAIVCGGGPAPGINSVISGIVREATRHGWDVIGIYDGFSRLACGEKNYVRLDPAGISRIHMTGVSLRCHALTRRKKNLTFARWLKRLPNLVSRIL